MASHSSVFLPAGSQGRWALWAAVYRVTRSRIAAAHSSSSSSALIYIFSCSRIPFFHSLLDSSILWINCLFSTLYFCIIFSTVLCILPKQINFLSQIQTVSSLCTEESPTITLVGSFALSVNTWMGWIPDHFLQHQLEWVSPLSFLITCLLFSYSSFSIWISWLHKSDPWG